MVDSLSDDRDAASIRERAAGAEDARRTRQSDESAARHAAEAARDRDADRGADAGDEKNRGNEERDGSAARTAASNAGDDAGQAVVVDASMAARLAEIMAKKTGNDAPTPGGDGHVPFAKLKNAIGVSAVKTAADAGGPAGNDEHVADAGAAPADAYIKAAMKDAAHASAGADDNADGEASGKPGGGQPAVPSASARGGIDIRAFATDASSDEHAKPAIDIAELVKAATTGGSQESSAKGVATTVAAHAFPHISAASFASAISRAAEVVQTAAAELPPGTALDLVRAIRVQAIDGGGEARIMLRPEHFGEVTISIRVEEGQVLARVQAESPAVREWLQANQSLLRHQLSEQQLTLDRLEVSEPSESQEPDSRGSDERQQQEQRRARRPRQGDEFQTFEVVA